MDMSFNLEKGKTHASWKFFNLIPSFLILIFLSLLGCKVLLAQNQNSDKKNNSSKLKIVGSVRPKGSNLSCQKNYQQKI